MHAGEARVLSRNGSPGPIASLESDVRHHPPLFAAHAPRRLVRRRCCSARARRRFRLRWFRSRKTTEEQAPIEAAAPAETPEPVTAEPAAEAGQSTTTKPRRRRGSRGGRGRTRKTAEPKAEKTEEKPAAKQARPERRPQRRERERPQQRRRREPARRAPLPEAKRELLVSVDVGEQRVAVLEDDRVAEVYLER